MLKSISAWIIGVLITVVYAYAVIAAVGNLTGMIGLGGALGTGLSATGWTWLIVGVLMPIIVFGLALLIGRKRSAWMRVLALAAGLTVVAICQIDIMHLILESSYFG